MPYAVVMLIEKPTAPGITALWKLLAEKDADGHAKFSDEQVKFNYPPYITLAAVEEAADPDALIETLKPIVAGWTPLPISLVQRFQNINMLGLISHLGRDVVRGGWDWIGGSSGSTSSSDRAAD